MPASLSRAALWFRVLGLIALGSIGLYFGNLALYTAKLGVKLSDGWMADPATRFWIFAGIAVTCLSAAAGLIVGSIRAINRSKRSPG